MTKSENLILNYEIERQKVQTLKSERVNLRELCVAPDSCDDGRGGVFHFQGELCLQKAWSEMCKMNQENDDNYSYVEVLAEVGCEHCIKSYEIKTGALAEARKEFGSIKRRISYLGKKLIKEGAE